MNLASGLTYETFSQHPIYDRIDWIDELTLQQVKEEYDSRSIKRFLSQLFELENNEYLRQRALEYLSELTLLEVIRYDYTKDFLLEEAKPTGNTFIDIIRLKYLFLLYGDDEECYQVFLQEAKTVDLELAAEACYRAGLVHLLYRFNQDDSAVMIDELHQAKRWFESAQQKAENRIDARFFSLTSDYLLALLSFHPESADNFYNELEQLLWERQLWDFKPNTDLLECRIFQSLSKLRMIVHKTAQEPSWTNYKKEFLFLSNCFNELLLQSNLSSRFVRSADAFTRHSLSNLINRYYVHNLTACQVKIRAILLAADPTEESLIEFLTNLSGHLDGYREKKKDNSINIIAALCTGFNWVNPSLIIEDVAQLKSEGLPDVLIQAQLAMRYAGNQRANTVSYITGYEVGDEIIQSVLVSLKQFVPRYPPIELAIFTQVLSDLVRYAYQAETQPKRFFPYLYDPSITLEEVFQNQLFIRLTAGERADMVLNIRTRNFFNFVYHEPIPTTKTKVYRRVQGRCIAASCQW